MFKVFERFPEDDGAGVFWSIVHGLKSLDNYENDLIASLQRQPSEMGMIMLVRLKKSGKKEVAGSDINEIYKNVLDHPNAPESIKNRKLH